MRDLHRLCGKIVRMNRYSYANGWIISFRDSFPISTTSRLFPDCQYHRWQLNSSTLSRVINILPLKRFPSASFNGMRFTWNESRKTIRTASVWLCKRLYARRNSAQYATPPVVRRRQKSDLGDPGNSSLNQAPCSPECQKQRQKSSSLWLHTQMDAMIIDTSSYQVFDVQSSSTVIKTSVIKSLVKKSSVNSSVINSLVIEFTFITSLVIKSSVIKFL